jgi:hypothetical protein
MKHHYCGYHKTQPTVISLCVHETEGRKEIIEHETKGKEIDCEGKEIDYEGKEIIEREKPRARRYIVRERR